MTAPQGRTHAQTHASLDARASRVRTKSEHEPHRFQIRRRASAPNPTGRLESPRPRRLHGWILEFPDLTFFSDAKETSGWQATLERYKSTYASPGHEMGKLDFSDLRVEMLGPEAAFVRGSWHLTMSDGKTPHGRFTLIFRKLPGGWKIIHDHTSAAKD
jgi:ketosteroid isomerase-like protein